MGRKKGKSICIFSTKGGTGCSITALNLAGIFSLANKKVLLIDYDLSFGSIALMLNKSFNKTIYNFVDDYANNRFKSLSDYVTKYNDNIYFLPSTKDPRQSAKICVNYIELIIEKAIFEYDYVIIDTNHDLSEKNVFLLDYVDKILLIMGNDLANIKNMRSLLKIFDDANIRNYKILLNESISLYKKYFSLYDIKKMIEANIDYYIDNSFFIKNIDNYIYDGSILTLDKRFTKTYPKINKVFNLILKDMEEENE